MNAQEGINITKMAISCLLLCLALSAVMGIWYLMSDRTLSITRRWETTTNITTTERMQELIDISESAVVSRTPTAITFDVEKLPLATNVASALSEYNEDGLIYICVGVYTVDATNTSLQTNVSVDYYTYDNSQATITNVEAGANLHDQTTQPVSLAVRQILQNSDSRAFITQENPVINGVASDYIAYRVNVYKVIGG